MNLENNNLNDGNEERHLCGRFQFSLSLRDRYERTCGFQHRDVKEEYDTVNDYEEKFKNQGLQPILVVNHNGCEPQ